MTTVCIHHHEDDTFAAEVIAGALLSGARVRLQAYPASLLGLPEGRPRRAGWHLLLWTLPAQQHDVISAMARLLHAGGARYLLLRRRDAVVPSRAGPDEQWPMFERGCDWEEYRGMLRMRLGIGDFLPPEPVLRGMTLPQILTADFPLTMTVAAGGALLWALLR